MTQSMRCTWKAATCYKIYLRIPVLILFTILSLTGICTVKTCQRILYDYSVSKTKQSTHIHAYTVIHTLLKFIVVITFFLTVHSDTAVVTVMATTQGCALHSCFQTWASVASAWGCLALTFGGLHYWFRRRWTVHSQGWAHGGQADGKCAPLGYLLLF